MTWLRRLEMPLLMRELRELAARRRTYVLRFVYAACLFGLAVYLLYGRQSSVLGGGREVFTRLVQTELLFVLVFLPVVISGTITVEKERDALGLLLLTTLGSMRIVFQKLLSRLIPMISFLLLGLPVMAVAYSMGGITEDELIGSNLVLLGTTIQVACIGMACSSWFRTTAESLGATYLITAVFVWPMTQQPHANFTAASLLPFSLWWLICLGFAIAVLPARAFVTPRNLLLKFFKALDDFFTEWNEHTTGGIVLVRDKNILPAFQPVSWRETARKSLGTFRYQFRILAAMELPILFVCQLLHTGLARDSPQVRVMLAVMWLVSLSLIAVHGSSLISSERSRQTLDVLLTTPIAGRSILKQKFHGVRRLIVVLLIAFVTVHTFSAWWEHGYVWMVFATAFTLVHLVLAAWLSMLIGQATTSQLRAIILSFVAIAALIIVPAFAFRWIVQTPAFGGSEFAQGLGFVLSPFHIQQLLQESLSGNQAERQRLLLVGLHTAVYCFAALAFRLLTLRSADARLGRIPEGLQMPEVPPAGLPAVHASRPLVASSVE